MKLLGGCLPLKLYQLIPSSRKETEPTAVVPVAALIGVPTELQGPMQMCS